MVELLHESYATVLLLAERGADERQPLTNIQPEDTEKVKCKKKANGYCLLQLDICIRHVPDTAHNQIQIAMICEQLQYTVYNHYKGHHSNIR